MIIEENIEIKNRQTQLNTQDYVNQYNVCLEIFDNLKSLTENHGKGCGCSLCDLKFRVNFELETLENIIFREKYRDPNILI